MVAISHVEETPWVATAILWVVDVSTGGNDPATPLSAEIPGGVAMVWGAEIPQVAATSRIHMLQGSAATPLLAAIM